MIELGTILELPLGVIHRTGWNPRKLFELDEISESIRERGVIVPIAVRPRPDGEYDLVDGDRRFTSSENLNLPTIPAIARDYTDAEVKETMYLANLHRADLSPLEEAGGLRMLLDDLSMTQAELGKKLGKSQGYVANRLRLLTAPDELKKLLISRKITQKHIIAALPFTAYPVWPEVLDWLTDSLKKDVVISVSRFKHDLSYKLSWSDHVLDLGNFEYRYLDIEPLFNRDGCDSCIHAYTTIDDDHNPPKTCVYCLDESCWSSRLKSAESTFTQSKQDSNVISESNAIVPGSIDTESMNWSEYENLSNQSWDSSECVSCDSSGPQQSDQDCLICVDTQCAAQKRKIYEKAIFVARNKDRQSAIKKADDYLLDIGLLDLDDLRVVLSSVLRDREYNLSLVEALEPWPQFVDKKSPLVDILASIPNRDIAPILLRVSLFQTVLRVHSSTKSFMDDITAAIEVSK